ncbi:MAG: UxaA family hydrolase [Streptosporangiales bacterium]|nr:UxaA family hydrolase [Streptosporangiales bacterium]MBO0891845.1 UxaA family hydrolase [Acidothermales bacterium]
MAENAPDFLAHATGDSVGVAVRDLSPGRITGGFLDGTAAPDFELLEPVPLGHKFAMTDIADGADVVEYGVRVGLASRAVKVGEHVHVHNMRSARWQNSVA